MPFVDFKVVAVVCLFPLQISLCSKAYDNAPLGILDSMMIYLKGHFCRVTVFLFFLVYISRIMSIFQDVSILADLFKL